MSQTLTALVIVALLVTGIAVHGFIYRYVRYSNWRATQPGRSLLYAKIAIAGMVDLSLIRYAFGDDWPGRLFVLAVFFWAVAGSQFYLFLTLLETQKRRKTGEYRGSDAGARPSEDHNDFLGGGKIL